MQRNIVEETRLIYCRGLKHAARDAFGNFQTITIYVVWFIRPCLNVFGSEWTRSV